MKIISIFVCVLLLEASGLYIQSNGTSEELKHEEIPKSLSDDNQKKAPHLRLAEKSNEILEVLTKCLFKEIIEGMQFAIKKRIEENNESLHNILGTTNVENQEPPGGINSANIISKEISLRPKRSDLENGLQQAGTSDWNKCVTSSGLDQQTTTENHQILILKQEISKLQQLVRLLQDQQYILNILNDMKDQTVSKFQTSKEMEEFLQFLKNYPSKEINKAMQSETEPREDSYGLELSIKELKNQVARLRKIIDSNNLPLKHDLDRQIQSLQNLQKLMKKMENLKHTVDLHNSQENEIQNSRIINELENTTNKIEMDSFVGAQNTPNRQVNFSQEAPKARAESDDFLENLQKLFGIVPEASTHSNNKLEVKLQELEQQIQQAIKVHRLQKQLQNIQHSTDLDLNELDNDDDEGIRTQLKKIQHDIKKLQHKPEIKGLDDGNDIIEERLQELQSAIDNLRPKSSLSNTQFEGKDDIQAMLNRLLPPPTPPIIPNIPQPTTNFATEQFHLTPAQIQLLKTKIIEASNPSNIDTSLFGIPVPYQQSGFNPNSFVMPNDRRLYPFTPHVFPNNFEQYMKYGFPVEENYGMTIPGYEYKTLKNQYPIYPKGNQNSYGKAVNQQTVRPNMVQGVMPFFLGNDKYASTVYQPTKTSGVPYTTKPYSNSQDTAPTSSIYSQAPKVEDLRAQIANLENVINNLHKPEYMYDPQEQNTVYQLDNNINELKNVINNLSTDQGYSSPNIYRNFGNQAPQVLTRKEQRRKTREISNFPESIFEQMAVNFSPYEERKSVNVLEQLFKKATQEIQDTANKTQSNVEQHNNIESLTRTVRETPQENMLHSLISKVSFLVKSLNHITHELLRSNCSCTDKISSINQGDSKQRVKRDESSNAVSELASFFKDILDEVKDEEKAQEGDKNTDQTGHFTSHQLKLQQKLQELKNQYQKFIN